ncbi:MAG: hypothetical protein K6U03_07100 [Firmicutes bacterium]|nr:hypothetical protein [Bacillota bacterium]
MDRVLTVAQRISFTLEPAAEAALARFAGGSGAREYLLGQFSGSVWAYPLEDGIRLVTKPFTATARLIRVSAGEALLSLQEVEPTTPREVTTVFREGQKILAEWSLVGEDGEAKGSEGAWILWRALRGEGDPGPPPIPVFSSEPPEAMTPPATKKAKGEEEEERILPQSEIDRLITALKNRGVGASERKGEVESISLDGARQKREESTPPPAAEHVKAPSLEGEASPAIEPGENVASAETSAESRLQTTKASWGLSEDGLEGRTWGFLEGIGAPQSSLFGLAGAPQPLAELIEGRPYTVVVFKDRGGFERELAACREKTDGTLMALWAGDPILIRLGPRTRAHLEELRSTANGAAAFLEANKERIRRLEQILPNLGEYRKKQGALAVAAAEVAKEMKALRLNQVMGTHEGRYLARKIFATEAHRQALSKKLAVATHRVFHRSTSLARSRFSKLHTQFFLVQRELETWFEKLSALEREVQRRLEYQADWQELVKQQIGIERELGEIARLIAMAAEVPPEVAGDPEATRRWLSLEREALRRREEFLRTWADYLTEERAWIARTQEEPFVILGDEPLLALPGVTCGAHLVIVADEGATTSAGLSGIYESCTDWVITDATFKVIETGQGLGQMMEPVSSLAEELARRMGIESGEAMRTLGLLEAQKTDGYSMGVV